MNFKKIEEKWQKIWEKEKWHRAVDFDQKRKKKYVLVEFPYPSGEGLHIGHAFTMTGSDVYARFQRMNGFNVLFPMGWDAFGLPTENYCIRNKIKPQIATKNNTDNFRRQMKKMAFSFDWDREVNTTDSKYYKWTQWIFIQLFKKGLAYKEKKPINWCPACKIGLANEEVIAGKCERCGEAVFQKELEQWIVKITDYADRLIEGLNSKDTDFIQKVKMAQINWIGRSEGVKIKFKIDGFSKKLEVFTTRPDTLWGATFIVIAPEHWLVQKLINKNKIRNYVERAKKKTELERAELQKEKTGIFSGFYAVNPANGKKIPIWISDFVVINYGTGAIMAVPAHDERDFAFAGKFGLPVVPVIQPKQSWDFEKSAYISVESGEIINSGFINGLTPSRAIKKVTDWLLKEKIGEKAINYHLRDWIFSRQHYWGEPIPMVYCQKCGWQPVKEEDLPVELPEVEKYEPTDTGESPLAKIKSWAETKCPKCNGPGKRETDTMPNWAGSDWYFLRYLDSSNDFAIADMKKMEYWLPVDVYIGGDEHNTLHMLYSRFIYQFLHDLGVVPKKYPEPYYRRVSHGVILGPDGQRMSKSRGNVVIPGKITSKGGVDVLRTYMMFMGPFEGTMTWNDKALKGVAKFLEKFEKFIIRNGLKAKNGGLEVKVSINKLIKKISQDIEKFQFNTAIAALMKFLNHVEKNKLSLAGREKKELVRLIAPFAPYLAEELWHELDEEKSVHRSQWPNPDPKYLVEKEVEVVAQINGKLRGVIRLGSEEGQKQELVKKQAEKNQKINQHLKAGKIVKVVFIPGKLINFVVK